MGFSRKPSQPRDVLFTTDFPALPASATDEIRSWWEVFKSNLKEDQKRIEDAFAALKSAADQTALLARIAALDSRIAALEQNPFVMPLIFDRNVAENAEIKESKLDLNYPTHSNANDPTAGQKAALTGTYSVPGEDNRFVTELDPRIREIGESIPPLEKAFSSQSTWTWDHNLGFKPIVQAFNDSGEELACYKKHISENTVAAYHTYNVSGVLRILDH